jgi:DNA processing protein
MTCVQHRSRPREERGLLKPMLLREKIYSTKRIISGLSQGILVTEAPKQSGALITANFALEHGREVFAVPNGIYAMGSVGVNKLIQDGAHLVTDVQDILMSLNLFMIPEHIEMQVALPDNEEEGALLPLLSHDPLHIDEIIRISELPTMTVTSTLQKA